uniref:G-protein coupled receptors family 1 profile domain-containing protein n=1 Tax=Globodera rostochiensis TaxID=31243 RepID=A0A914IEW3_GLORO
MNSTEDPSFYDAFKDDDFPIGFIVICIVRLMLSIVGLIFNGALIFVTFRSRRLRSRCNALLAFDAACSGIAFVCNFVTFAVVCSGKKFIELRQCFWLQFLPTIAMSLLLNSMLAVGIERLVSVVAPFWVNTLNSTLYVGTLILLCFANAVYTMVRLYPISLIETPDMPVTCTINDLYQGEVGMALFGNAMLFTGLTILCYAIIWATLRFKKAKQNTDQTQIDYTKRIFKCLLVNVIFVSTGYFLNVAVLILLTRISLSQVQIVFATYILGIITGISAIGTVPTLYIFSSDYREAFNEKLFRSAKQAQLLATVVGLKAGHAVATAQNGVQNVRRVPVQMASTYN